MSNLVEVQKGLKINVAEPEKKEEPILVTVDLSESQCRLGSSVNYTITFNQPITVSETVPISIVNRDGLHIENVGCDVVGGVASGVFTPTQTGDFTITNTAINYHQKLILSRLELVEQPWLRVYQ